MNTALGTASGWAPPRVEDRPTLAPPSVMHNQVFRALANGHFERVHDCLDLLQRQGDPIGEPLASGWQNVVRASLLAGEEIRSGRGTAGLRAAPAVCERADSLLLDARQVFDEGLEGVDRAAALIRIAEVAVLTGRLDLATDTTAEAAGLLETSQIRNVFVAGCLTRIANLLGELDLLPLGVGYMRKAYDIGRMLGIPKEVAHRAHQLAGMSCELGESLLAEGEQAAAKRHFSAARDLCVTALDESAHSSYDASLNLVLAWAYVGLGDSRAFEILNTLRHLGADDERPWVRAAADQGLGRAYRRAGHHAAALTHYTQSHAAFRRLGMPRALRSVMRELGETYVEFDQPERGLPAMRRYLAAELTRDADQRALCTTMFDRRRSVVEDEQAAGQLRRLAFEDPLTERPNRHFAESRMKALFDAGETPVLAVVDVDCLKQINDSEGHLMGDLVLREVARIITKQCRQSDDVCRWAGDEFVILMSNTTTDQAVIALDRVREAIATRDWAELGLNARVTVSIGVASATWGDTSGSLFAAADGLLFTAKRQGRNQVARPQGTARVLPAEQLSSVLRPRRAPES